MKNMIGDLITKRSLTNLVGNMIVIIMIIIALAFIIIQPFLLVPGVIFAILVGLSKEEIKVKYFADITPIEKIAVGDWIDLRASERVEMNTGDFKYIPLGVGMILPDGYEAHMLPRSSTLKNYGIIAGNSMGIIDNSYSGDTDEWHFPAVAFRKTVIEKDERICQFRIVKTQPKIRFKKVLKLKDKSRGGLGSTGKA